MNRPTGRIKIQSTSKESIFCLEGYFLTKRRNVKMKKDKSIKKEIFTPVMVKNPFWMQNKKRTSQKERSANNGTMS